MANSSGNRREQANQAASTFFGGTNPSNSNFVPDNSGAGMKHDPGIAVEWTADEQAILEEGLQRYASEPSIGRYAKIAVHLPNKTVRDVALRSRWMNKKEFSKRRKEEHNVTKKSRDKKERIPDSSAKPTPFAPHTNLPPYASTMFSLDFDHAIGGAAGELLQQNARALDQISANFASLKLEDNINLFCQIRSNILKIMNNLNETPDFTRQMPQLPEKLNEELANSILPPTYPP